MKCTRQILSLSIALLTFLRNSDLFPAELKIGLAAPGCFRLPSTRRRAQAGLLLVVAGCSRSQQLPGVVVQEQQRVPRDLSAKGLAARGHPPAPARSKAAEGHWGSPSPGHQHLHGGKDGRRLGQDESPGVSPGHHGPRPGRAGLGGAGHQPFSGVTKADGPEEMMWGPGLWAGEESPRTVAGQGRDVLAVPLGPWFLSHLFLRYGFFPARREASPSEMGIHISRNCSCWRGLRRRACLALLTSDSASSSLEVLRCLCRGRREKLHR